MIKLYCLKNKDEFIVFDLFEDRVGEASLEELNKLMKKDDTEIIEMGQLMYQPPPMFPDEQTGSRARLLMTVKYRKKGRIS
jgi:hypothetical protein